MYSRLNLIIQLCNQGQCPFSHVWTGMSHWPLASYKLQVASTSIRISCMDLWQLYSKSIVALWFSVKCFYILPYFNSVQCQIHLLELSLTLWLCLLHIELVFVHSLTTNLTIHVHDVYFAENKLIM